jgi:phosphonate transport system substrate-binding protein
MINLTYTTAQAESTEPVMEAVFNHLAAKLEMPITAVHNIPWQDRIHRIAQGRIDIGWICGSYYSRLADRSNPVVELLVAPILAQSRYEGQPVYYSDLVVRQDSPFQTFEDLRGASFAYNEPGSMSGYYSMRYYLAKIGEYGGFFGRLVESGGHVNSLRMILKGEVDTAAIDSMVMTPELQERPELASQTRVVEVLGPTPIPPWVIQSSLPEALRDQIRQALITMHEDEEGRKMLDSLQLKEFSAVSDNHYDLVREMIVKSAEVDW